MSLLSLSSRGLAGGFLVLTLPAGAARVEPPKPVARTATSAQAAAAPKTGATAAPETKAANVPALKPIKIVGPIHTDLQAAKSYPIRWTDASKKASHVSIHLLYANAVFQVISASTINNGAFEWVVPVHDKQTPNAFALKVTGIGQNAEYTDSKPVTLWVPQVKFTKPLEGATLKKTESQNVVWQKQGAPDWMWEPKVKIEVRTTLSQYDPPHAIYSQTWANTGQATLWLGGIADTQFHPQRACWVVIRSDSGIQEYGRVKVYLQRSGQ